MASLPLVSFDLFFSSFFLLFFSLSLSAALSMVGLLQNRVALFCTSSHCHTLSSLTHPPSLLTRLTHGLPRATWLSWQTQCQSEPAVRTVGSVQCCLAQSGDTPPRGMLPMCHVLFYHFCWWTVSSRFPPAHAVLLLLVLVNGFLSCLQEVHPHIKGN